jgi:hypothetical protein
LLVVKFGEVNGMFVYSIGRVAFLALDFLKSVSVTLEVATEYVNAALLFIWVHMLGVPIVFGKRRDRFGPQRSGKRRRLYSVEVSRENNEFKNTEANRRGSIIRAEGARRQG